jgi:hypothetical protein
VVLSMVKDFVINRVFVILQDKGTGYFSLEGCMSTEAVFLQLISYIKNAKSFL